MRVGTMAALGLHVHFQRVGVGDPVVQGVVQRHRKSGLFEYAVIVVGPCWAGKSVVYVVMLIHLQLAGGGAGTVRPRLP